MSEGSSVISNSAFCHVCSNLRMNEPRRWQRIGGVLCLRLWFSGAQLAHVFDQLIVNSLEYRDYWLKAFNS